MNERDALISHALDLKEKAATESYITYTNFLSADELSELIKTEKINNRYVDTFYYGGCAEAERKIAVFVPAYFEADADSVSELLSENGYTPVQLLKIQKDRFSELSHRDYLGAVMSLGIKREMIGDIIVTDDGCDLFCTDSVSNYICENLKQAGRGQLTVRKAPLSESVANSVKTETAFVSVASMRLDCLVAVAFKLSRNNAVTGISQGYVYVNGEQILKRDFILKSGDKLVFRGKGKTLIDEVVGASKKGRLHINIKKYI